VRGSAASRASAALPTSLQASRTPSTADRNPSSAPSAVLGNFSCRTDQRPSRSGRSTLRMSGSPCFNKKHWMTKYSCIRLVDAVPDPGERLLGVTIPQRALRGPGGRAGEDGMSKRMNRWICPLTLARDHSAAQRPCWLPGVPRGQSRPTPFVLQPLLAVPARSDLDSRSWPAVKIQLAYARMPRSAGRPGPSTPSSSAAS
jgi:hypothetical protein